MVIRTKIKTRVTIIFLAQQFMYEFFEEYLYYSERLFAVCFHLKAANVLLL